MQLHTQPALELNFQEVAIVHMLRGVEPEVQEMVMEMLRALERETTPKRPIVMKLVTSGGGLAH